jgi:pSer/pThr/pTyr-binding forkhead associated (FHA) protein
MPTQPLRNTAEPEYGTAALNKRKKTFTIWPEDDYQPSEVIEVTNDAPDWYTDRGSLWRVLLHIAGNQVTTIGMDIRRVTVLGRADPFSSFRPDVDFAPYSGMRLGISRRHALLYPDRTYLSLVDQHSTNGTWVNGERLSPGREHVLKDGDRVELGDFKFAVRIMNSPVGLVGDAGL